MSWLLLPIVIALGIWKLSVGEPLWLIPLAIVGFAEWFMADRPARSIQPSQHETVEPTPAERHR